MSSHSESVPESPPNNNNIDNNNNSNDDEESSALAILSRDEMIDDDLYEQLLVDDDDENNDEQKITTTEVPNEQSYDDNSQMMTSNDPNETGTTANNYYEYQEGFSSDVQNKTILEILQSFFDTDYPPPPLVFHSSDNESDLVCEQQQQQLIMIPFPTLEQLKITFRSMGCLYLFTFLSKYAIDGENFKKEFLYQLQTLPVKHKGFILDHVDIIFHDIAQQVLLRAPRSLLDIANDATSTLSTTYSSSPKFLSLGDETLDSLFETPITRRDGIFGLPFKETSGGFVVELSGVAGSGKTQLALQLCLQSVLPEEFGGLASKSMYLFSEQNPVERLNEMAQARVRQCNEYYRQHGLIDQKKMETSHLMDNIIQRKILTREDLDNILVKKNQHSMTLLENEIDKRGIKLVVLDSMGMLYREMPTNTTVERAAHLQNQAQSMKYLATKYRVMFIVLNQVTSFFQEESETTRRYHQSHRNESFNNEDAHSAYLYNTPKEVYHQEDEDNNNTNDEDDFMIGDISKVRSYFRVTPSEISKPALGLYWSTLVDIRLFITKLNRKDVVIGSKKNLSTTMGIQQPLEKKQKINNNSNASAEEKRTIVYLRDYSDESVAETNYSETSYSRQLHVIYSPFSPTTSRSFVIDSFGVKGL